MTLVSHQPAETLAALAALAAAAGPPGTTELPGAWRWRVHRRMAAVRDALLAETAGSADGWLAARGGTAYRSREVLLTRLGVLGARVLTEADLAPARRELDRLVVDIAHHVQRLHDLAYDEVELELGGSE